MVKPKNFELTETPPIHTTRWDKWTRNISEVLLKSLQSLTYPEREKLNQLAKSLRKSQEKKEGFIHKHYKKPVQRMLLPSEQCRVHVYNVFLSTYITVNA